MCNENSTFPDLPAVPSIPSKHDKQNSDYSWRTILSITVPLVVISVLIVTVILLKMRKNHLKEMKRLPTDLGNIEMAGLIAKPIGDSTLRDEFGQNYSCEVTSGSGSGNLDCPFFCKQVNSLIENVTTRWPLP